MRKSLRAIGKVVTFCAAAASVAWSILFAYVNLALENSPVRRNSITGNVIPWNDHGLYHYVTRFDDGLNDGLRSAAPIIILVFFVGLFLLKGWQMFDKR